VSLTKEERARLRESVPMPDNAAWHSTCLRLRDALEAAEADVERDGEYWRRSAEDWRKQLDAAEAEVERLRQCLRVVGNEITTAEEDEDQQSTGDCPAHHHRVEVLRHELQDRLGACVADWLVPEAHRDVRTQAEQERDEARAEVERLRAECNTRCDDYRRERDEARGEAAEARAAAEEIGKATDEQCYAVNERDNDCGHQCFVIGGPFVRYDPDCPVHGLNRDRARDALTRERDLSDRLAAALREHQWDGSHHAPYDDGTCDHYCTTCSADASDGHTDDCAVFLALAEHAAARNKEEP
jgi:hypothetical protein